MYDKKYDKRIISNFVCLTDYKNHRAFERALYIWNVVFCLFKKKNKGKKTVNGVKYEEINVFQ